MNERLAPFVLVHGAWHGGWCWSRVAQLLRHDGRLVHMPTLTGVGERSHHYHDEIDLDCHIADVVNEIVFNDLRDVVLCGHSYGGMVITGVIERIPDRINSIVYLDAFLPSAGQSASVISGFTPGDGPVPPRTAESLGVGLADRAWVDTKLTPQPPRTLTQPIGSVDALSRFAGEKTYVLATVGSPPFLRAAHALAEAAQDWTAHTIDCGHDIMIDRPAELAEILLKAAQCHPAVAD